MSLSPMRDSREGMLGNGADNGVIGARRPDTCYGDCEKIGRSCANCESKTKAMRKDPTLVTPAEIRDVSEKLRHYAEVCFGMLAPDLIDVMRCAASRLRCAAERIEITGKRLHMAELVEKKACSDRDIALNEAEIAKASTDRLSARLDAIETDAAARWQMQAVRIDNLEKILLATARNGQDPTHQVVAHQRPHPQG